MAHTRRYNEKICHQSNKNTKRTKCSKLCFLDFECPDMGKSPQADRRRAERRLCVFLKQKAVKTPKNGKVFYRHYITATHRRHWPTFFTD